MYRRHNWDEDRWDIHSTSNYAGHKSSSSGKYIHHGKNPAEEYHKRELYGSKEPEDKIKDDYRSSRQEDEDKKKEEQNENQEKTIADAVEQEEKKNREEEQENEFKSFTNELKQEHFEDKRNDKIKKKQHNTIEEAINKAIKEEKETVFVD